jgi:hypothetical protein
MVFVPFVFVSVALTVGAIIALTIMLRAYLRHRGKSLVTCPETRRPAAVRVDVERAALKAATIGPARLELDLCSRWPEHQDCGQSCLSQIENDAECCHVWNIVQQWFRGRSCAYCEKPIEQVHWHDHRPALLGPDKKTVQWTDVPPEKLPEVFETHSPVCWSCHIAETFRREHPDDFVDRPGNRGAMGEYVEDRPLPAAAPDK